MEENKMVFNDITSDYATFMNLLDMCSTETSYIGASLILINQYHSKMTLLSKTFLVSPKTQQPRDSLIAGLSSLEKDFSEQIAIMSSSMRDATKLISQIETMNFSSNYLKKIAAHFCQSLNTLMDITEEYSSNKIKGTHNISTFFKLIDELEHFNELHIQIYNICDLFKNIEPELLQNIPLDETNNNYEFYYLDIRSFKPESNIASFTDDLKLLADCLQHLERLVCPSENHCIYMRKIESGSLKAMFGSSKIDFSIFPDLITSISNAIKTWRLTPVERKKTQAETDKLKAETELIYSQTEAQRIQNESSKMAILTSQIDYLCEKLSLDPQNAENREQIQKFCLPLVTYIEHNPIGSFNGTNYDVSREVHLLEYSSSQESW